jgi:hypothetical protein
MSSPIVSVLYILIFLGGPLAGLLYLLLHHGPERLAVADPVPRPSTPSASSSLTLPPDPGLGSLVLESLLDHVPERPEALPVGAAVHTGAGRPPGSLRKRRPCQPVPIGAVVPVLIAGELVPIAPELRRQTEEDPPTPTGVDVTRLRLFCADLPADHMDDFRHRLRESDAELLFLQALDRPQDLQQIPAGLIDPEIES